MIKLVVQIKVNHNKLFIQKIHEMSLKIKIEDLASRKMVGHALKHMTEDVYGTLIITQEANQH